MNVHRLGYTVSAGGEDYFAALAEFHAYH